MNSAIPELWSDDDRAAAEMVGRAVADDDLLSALLAVEGASPQAGLDAARSIATMGAEVRSSLASGGHGPDTRVQALARAIAGGFGLRGADGDDYFSPANSCLTAVLARRRGQPILVTAVWILVGQASGVDVHGVGFPGHFLASVDGIVVDPFGGGSPMEPEDVRRLAERVMPGRRFQEEWLGHVGTDAIAERVLRNLAFAHQRAGDVFSRYRALRLLSALRRDDATLMLEVALMSEELGAWDLARNLYRDILRAHQGTREAQVAELKRLELQQKERTLH